ncbi:hypothetical protein ACHAW5_010981 [Stephanodiscus triporus]|uniref:Uncharacterized protein n=1 Tax=Stephanodiscus triporus TaxID=2934178 RepID=A0ABD3NPA3_9STRA
MAASVVPGGGSTKSPYSNNDDDDDDDDDAEEEGKEDRPPHSDGEALQSLFSRHCDPDGLMTRRTCEACPRSRPCWASCECERHAKGRELTTSELDALFRRGSEGAGTRDMLDEDGIDDLFENDEVVEGGVGGNSDERELKEELLELLGDIAKVSAEEGRLLCGLILPRTRARSCERVEREPYNQVVSSRSGGGSGTSKEELIGLWDLIYSSSSTMNGGLTRFGGLQQSLSATKYLSDVEYTEQVINKLGGKSFEVKVTGDWDLRTEISLFTGKPSDVLSITPDKVSYGPRSDKADHWKSLGPMNLLVLSYLTKI